MNLECPGCRSRLKVDPSRLPAGATTAVCPRCRTKILLPGSAADGGEVGVQCPHCAARLKVNIARLKPGISRSRCPKCSGLVDLPAAPAPAPSPAADATGASGRTRRIDPREMAVILGAKGPAGASSAAGARQPLPLEERFEVSDLDLGRLIDDRVQRLAEESPPRPAVTSPAPGPPAGQPPSGAAPTLPSPPEPGPAARPLSSSGSRPQQEPEMEARRSISGSRRSPVAAPSFSAAIAPPRRSAGLLLLSGAVGGAVIGGLVAALGGVVPRYLVSPVPGWIASALGERTALGGVVLTLLLSAVGAWLGGVVFAPAPSEGLRSRKASGPGVLRIVLTSALVGLLAGLGLSLEGGELDLAGVLDWTRDLTLSGLVAGLVARALGQRP